MLLVCCRKIAEQRGPRAATGSLLPQADFSGGFTIRDANRASGARECHGVRWCWMDKEDGWVAGRVTKSSGGYFYAKLLVRRVNICMASRERVHLFLSLFAEDARIFLLSSEKLDIAKNENFDQIFGDFIS